MSFLKVHNYDCLKDSNMKFPLVLNKTMMIFKVVCVTSTVLHTITPKAIQDGGRYGGGGSPALTLSLSSSTAL